MDGAGTSVEAVRTRRPRPGSGATRHGSTRSEAGASRYRAALAVLAALCALLAIVLAGAHLRAVDTAHRHSGTASLHIAVTVDHSTTPRPDQFAVVATGEFAPRTDLGRLAHAAADTGYAAVGVPSARTRGPPVGLR